MAAAQRPVPRDDQIGAELAAEGTPVPGTNGGSSPGSSTGYDAGRLDGASEWKLATAIKLPMVAGSLVLTAIFSIIGTLQLFSEPQVLRTITSSISSSYTPNLFSYTQAFVANNPDYAAAIAVVLAIGTFILSFGFLKLVQRRWAGA